MEHTITIDTSNLNSRADIVKYIYKLFSEEIPGTPGESSYYTYYVETIYNGNRIYLRRPAPLNKGVDFTVNAERYTFLSGRRNLHNPKHDHIFDILSSYKSENQADYSSVISPLIGKIFRVEGVSNQEYYAAFSVFASADYPADLTLKLLKWLFIEQDVTYWNRSGRYMLMSGLIERGLV